jgi:hypothetical protein
VRRWDGRLEGPDGLAQPRFERHVRFPAQFGSCLGDVGLAHLRVLERERFVPDGAVAVRQLDTDLGKLQNRPFVGSADGDQGLDVGVEQRLEAVDGIRDGAVTPGPRAVAGDGQILAGECLSNDGGDTAPVVGPHRGTGGVDDACGADAKVVCVAGGTDQRLAVAFRFVVPRPGAGRVIGAAVPPVVGSCRSDLDRHASVAESLGYRFDDRLVRGRVLDQN